MTENAQLFACLALFVLLSWLIARTVRQYRKPETADQVRAEQLRNARVQALQWRAQAEEATARADMFDARVIRLEGVSHD